MDFLFPSQHHERTVHRLRSLGLVEAGLGSSCMEELGGLADRDPEHGAVSDVTQDASVAAFWCRLRRRGRSQWAHFVTPSAAYLYEKDRRGKEEECEEMSFWTKWRIKVQTAETETGKGDCKIHWDRESAGEEDFSENATRERTNEMTWKWQWGTFNLWSI